MLTSCGDEGARLPEDLTQVEIEVATRQLQIRCEAEHPGPDATALCTCIVMAVAHGQDRGDATRYCGTPQMLQMMRDLGRGADAVGAGGGHHVAED